MIQIQTKHNRIVSLVLVLLMVLTITLTGFAYNDKTVVVMVDGAAHTVKTHLNSTEGIVREAGINLHTKDQVVIDTETLQDGSILTVVRASPVTVIVDGKTKTVMTVQRTAQGLADELGFKAPNYTPVGENTDSLQSGSTIRIAHVTSRSVKSAERNIDVQVVREKDDTLAKGDETIVQVGQPGVEKVQEETLYENGIAVKTHIISSEVTQAMVPTIVKEGTRDIVISRNVAGRASRVLTMEASAYLPGDGDGRGITATGIPATRGVVAVDPNVIPLGTRLFIPGYGEAIAADTGGAIVGNKIDLLMESYSEAISFGRQDITVYVLD